MEAVFLKLLEMSLSAGWLIGAVIALRLVLSKAPKWTRGILWALVAVRLACPVSIESAVSLVPREDAVAARINEYVGTEGTEARVRQRGTEPAALYPAGSTASFAEPGEYILNLGAEDAFGTPAEAQGWVWLAGLTAMGLYAILSWLRLRRSVVASVCLRDNLFLCDAVDSPFILGVFRRNPSRAEPGDRGHAGGKHPLGMDAHGQRGEHHAVQPGGWLGAVEGVA